MKKRMVILSFFIIINVHVILIVALILEWSVLYFTGRDCRCEESFDLDVKEKKKGRDCSAGDWEDVKREKKKYARYIWYMITSLIQRFI
jgi:hypothetical protein